MKILHVIKHTSKKFGGMPYALLNIIKLETNHLEYKSEVLSVETRFINTELEGIANNIFYFKSDGKFKGFKSASKWLAENGENYDLIQFHGIWNRLIIDLLNVSVRKNFRFTIWPHCSLDYHDLKKKKFLKMKIGQLYLKKFFTKAEFILTSPVEIQNSEFFIKNPKTKVLPLPIPQNDNILIESIQKVPFKENKELFSFLFLSRFDPKKGLDNLIPAFKLLLNEFKDIRLLIAGYDDSIYSKAIKAKIDIEINDERVLVLGFLNDEEKQFAFKNSECYLLPSYYENFGISTIEALQSGLPALITRNIYIYPDLEKYNAIWLCETNVDSIYKSLKNIYLNKEDYLVKKQNSISAANQYLPENLKDLYKNYYQI